MAEMTERPILVFDSNGLITNVDRLSWNIKAIVAQEEREKIARRVRNNLRYLKRGGNHSRPAAVVFTGDVLKDILGNPSYRGKVLVDGVLVEGKHPPLIDEATWEACAAVRTRNQRRTSKTWTRHSYPLTPLLYRGLCGGPMHGEASVGEYDEEAFLLKRSEIRLSRNAFARR
jgi:Recombinase